MRLFAIQDFQYWVLGFFLGLVAVVFVYMAWASYPRYRREESPEQIKALEGHEIDTGHHASEAPIAPFLIFVYIGTVLWSIAYMIYTGILKGVSF